MNWSEALIIAQREAFRKRVAPLAAALPQIISWAGRGELVKQPNAHPPYYELKAGGLTISLYPTHLWSESFEGLADSWTAKLWYYRGNLSDVEIYGEAPTAAEAIEVCEKAYAEELALVAATARGPVENDR